MTALIVKDTPKIHMKDVIKDQLFTSMLFLQSPNSRLCSLVSSLFSLNKEYLLIKTFSIAISSLPNNSDTYVILIASGNYREQLNVTRRGPTYLLGQTSHPKNHSLNTANVFWAAAAGTGDNAYSSVLTVAPNLNASLTGSGPTGFAVPDDTPFGCVDFRTYNLNFINDYANQCEYHSFLQTASHNLNNWEVID
jgi:hypothetical protein